MSAGLNVETGSYVAWKPGGDYVCGTNQCRDFLYCAPAGAQYVSSKQSAIASGGRAHGSRPEAGQGPRGHAARAASSAPAEQ